MTNNKQIIGMIHLPPLLGCEGFPGMEEVIEKALTDLEALEEGGVDGVLIENDNDKPHTVKISKEQLACFTLVAKEVIKNTSLPVGIGVLLDDYEAALTIAKTCGAEFIRLDVFVDKVKSKWGIIEVNPKEIIAFKKKIGALGVKIYTDIQVKHTEMLQQKSLQQSAQEALDNFSDGIIITGTWTGIPPKEQDLIDVREMVAAAGKPLIIGSGINKDNAVDLMKHASIAIVGTSIKEGDYVSEDKVRELVKTLTRAYGEDN